MSLQPFFSNRTMLACFSLYMYLFVFYTARRTSSLKACRIPCRQSKTKFNRVPPRRWLLQELVLIFQTTELLSEDRTFLPKYLPYQLPLSDMAQSRWSLAVSNMTVLFTSRTIYLLTTTCTFTNSWKNILWIYRQKQLFLRNNFIYNSIIC